MMILIHEDTYCCVLIVSLSISFSSNSVMCINFISKIAAWELLGERYIARKYTIPDGYDLFNYNYYGAL